MKKTLYAFTLFIVVLVFSPSLYARLIFVKYDAGGNNTGISWNDAFTSIHDALESSTAGDTIFVAAGTYYPDNGTGLTDNDKNASFHLKGGVVLMGGYSGYEDISPLSTRWKKYGRDWLINKTVLSGDLMQNDNGALSVNDPLRSDNSIHVVSVSAAVDSLAAEINGFIIEGGNSNSGDIENGLNGAGLWASNSRVNINNTLFRYNSSSGKGGAAYLFDSYLLVSKSSFIENSAQTGGGVYLENNSNNTDLNQKVLNSFFYKNKALNNGGAISLNVSAGAEMINNVMAENSVTGEGSAGGAIYADNESYPSVINNTIYNNTAVSSGAGIAISAGKIKNSIIRGNISANNQQVFIAGEPADPSAEREFSNSSIEGGFTGETIYDINPDFVSPGNPLGPDGLFGTMDDGLAIADFSAVIDSGNALVNTSLSDAGGMPRLSFSSVDLGAYEKQRRNNNLGEFLSDLQKGGYIVLFNHTMTNTSEIDSPGYQVDLHWCWMQKNLTPEGMEQARFLGGAIQFLDINFDVILCSPMCRTKESTRQMFGQDSTEHDIFKSSFIWLQHDTTYYTDRRSRLSTVLGTGHNTVIITHSDLIADMAGMNENEIKEGDAVVFLPLGNGNYEVVAHLTTDTWSQMFKQKINTTSVAEGPGSPPESFVLYDNYPNPFNPSTNLKFKITFKGLVTLKVFDILGREVKTLVNEIKAPGEYNVEFNAGGLGSGVYFANLVMNEKQITKKIVLLK